MRLRAVFFDVVLFLLWAVLCFIYFGILGFSILLAALGIVSGLAFGVVVALVQLDNLEKKGVFRPALKAFALALLTLTIGLPIVLYILLTWGKEGGVQTVGFMYPFIPALYAARITLYLNWERRHDKLLFSNWTKIYVAPKDSEEREGSP